MAHLSELGVFPGARSSEVMVDVVLLGPAHQACRVYLSAPGAVDPTWMRATLPELACGAMGGEDRAARRFRGAASAGRREKEGQTRDRLGSSVE